MSGVIKGIKSVRVLERTEAGAVIIARSDDDKKKKRKRSRAMRTPERNVRVLLNAMGELVDEARDRHDRSTRKRRDGWIRDWPKNSMKAQRKAAKKLRKLRLL